MHPLKIFVRNFKENGIFLLGVVFCYFPFQFFLNFNYERFKYERFKNQKQICLQL